ncbi:MAG: hypothetical protein SAK29_04390 [Scytonema sp. PMC 1069.18]|nr:hypothetical protein [Scytonema sp. PMC 1069.18]MEC4880097.1 hypothetical protein [Scytonema sp. PMC 1070.18]
MNQEQTQNEEKVENTTYGDKTERIKALSQFIKSVTPFVWTAVILFVIVPLLGRGFIASSLPNPLSNPNTSNPNTSHSTEVVIERTQQPWSQIDQDIVAAIKNADNEAKNFASARLDKWVDELMTRVDNSFLDWYFNYFNQKRLELSAPFVWLYSAVTHWIDTKNPTPNQAVAETLTEDFQIEFAKRVLRPKIAQLELEGITRDTVNLYISELETNISSIQSSYKIPQGEWERYLGDIAITITDSEGIVSNLSLKVLIGGGSYVIAKAAIPVMTKVGSKIVASFAGKAGAKVAAKTGGSVAAKIGAEFLDPIVGIGIIIWDLWDYHHTVNVNRPILREAILDYLNLVKDSLLENSENGIMSAIHQLESGILKSVKT